MKHPTAKAGGFYAVPPTERTRGGLRGALPAPCVRCNLRSGLWALLHHRLAHRTFGSLVLLPKGAYLGTGKHYEAVSVRYGYQPWDLRLTVLRFPREQEYCSSEASRMSICYPVTMGKHTIKPTTVCLEPQEREAIERIKELYGCPSDVATIRLVIRMVARQEQPPLSRLKRNAPSIPVTEVRGFTARFDKGSAYLGVNQDGIVYKSMVRTNSFHLQDGRIQ